MTETTPRPRTSARPWRLLRDILIIALVALLASFLIKTFVARSFYIPSGSMENTLQINDRIVVDELTPRFAGIQRGDIVVFTDSAGWLGPETAARKRGTPFTGLLAFLGLSPDDGGEHLVKRVIGLPGDRVRCCNALGQLSVNGKPVREPYLDLPPGQEAASLEPFSVTVPKGRLWVMGDNRDNSADSRAHMSLPGRGTIPIRDVVGRAFVVTWPVSRWAWLGSSSETFAGIG